MQRQERSLPINNATLQTLMQELGEECSRVLELMHQLQVTNLQDDQKADILAEVLASVIHLHTHCDEDLQGAISDESDSLPECFLGKQLAITLPNNKFRPNETASRSTNGFRCR